MLMKSRSNRYLLRAAIIAAIQVGFIVTKLTGLLPWHWLWVFAPLLLTAAAMGIVLFVAAFIILISGN